MASGKAVAVDRPGRSPVNGDIGLIYQGGEPYLRVTELVEMIRGKAEVYETAGDSPQLDDEDGILFHARALELRTLADVIEGAVGLGQEIRPRLRLAP